jgi:aspartate racemase
MIHRKIGILGGMGPAAGVYFAQRLIALNTGAKKDAEHVTFILYSDPQVPSRVDSFLEKTASPAPFLTASLQKLELLGADFGVMVCNTAHIYFDEIATKVNLPLINMVENVAMHVTGLKLEGRKVGLLATAATVKSGLYPCYFNGCNVEIVIPTDKEQDLITSAIFESEYRIKATGMYTSDAAKKMLAAAADSMRKRTGIQHLVLGCTELSFAIPTAAWEGFQIIDPVSVLAQTCLTRTETKGPAPVSREMTEHA